MTTLRNAEHWKPVVGYEELYEVSDRGRVRGSRRRGSDGRVLAIKYGKRGGYPVVSLYRSSRGTTRSVHGLMMEAFVGPRPPGHEIRHLDGDPKNAILANLAYGTSAENKEDMRRHGTDKRSQTTSCTRGHAYDEKNTGMDRGRKYCRKCCADRSRARYHANKALTPV